MDDEAASLHWRQAFEARFHPVGLGNRRKGEGVRHLRTRRQRDQCADGGLIRRLSETNLEEPATIGSLERGNGGINRRKTVEQVISDPLERGGISFKPRGSGLLLTHVIEVSSESQTIPSIHSLELTDPADQSTQISTD